MNVNIREVTINHSKFGEMTIEELRYILDFASNALSVMNGFEVWEAENIFSQEDDTEWNKKVIEDFTKLMGHHDTYETNLFGSKKEKFD